MAFLPSFDEIKRLADISIVKDELRVSFSYDKFVEVITMLISTVPIDEEWYLATNDDVQRGIESGHVSSAAQHFVEAGYFEGRLPFPPVVDEEWYLQEYPDVVDTIAAGEVESALQHFVERGYKEGRAPGPS